jgi:HK97 family phage prohead protease
MNIERKFVGGNIVETKEEERNGINVGIVAGYIATWDIDRGAHGVRDQFVRGAFSDSIRKHQVKQRMIRLKDHHGRTVGGFPIEQIREDEIGLYGVGEINMEVQQGQELMALLRQGALSDFSIGFKSIEDSVDEGLRKITKADIFEGSVVDEPMNPAAIVTEVKSFAPQDYEFNADDAAIRLKSANIEQQFIGDNPILDIIDGEPRIIPEALKIAASLTDEPTEIREIERYYAKLNLPSPFDAEHRQYYTSADVSELTPRMIEKALCKSGVFSKSAAKILAGTITLDKPGPLEDNNRELLEELRKVTFN